VVYRWYEFGGWPFGYATTEVSFNDHTWDTIGISGSCFPADVLVTITVCDEYYVIAQVETNDCGAFDTEADIVLLWSDDLGDWYYGYWEPWLEDTVSVRAWVNARTEVEQTINPWGEFTSQIRVVTDGDLMANWPLYLDFYPYDYPSPPAG